MSPPLNKRRAAALIDQARLHFERREWEKVVELGRALVASALELPVGFALLGDGLKQLGRREEAKAEFVAGLERFPHDADSEGRLGLLLLELEDVKGALEYLGRARAKKKRDPWLLTYSAAALLRAGRNQEAERLLAQAILLGGGLDAKLVLALVKARRGGLAEADALAAEVEAKATEPALMWAARAVRADSRLLMGDPAGAIERWKAIEAAGVLEPAQLAHMAYAAQAVGEVELADRLIARRMAEGPKAEDSLLFAQVDNLRREPIRALGRLAAAVVAEGDRGPGWEFQLEATKGRALRLAGRLAEAAEVLSTASVRPEASMRFGATMWVDWAPGGRRQRLRARHQSFRSGPRARPRGARSQARAGHESAEGGLARRPRGLGGGPRREREGRGRRAAEALRVSRGRD